MWSPNIKSARRGHICCAPSSADIDSVVPIFSCRCIVFIQTGLYSVRNTSPHNIAMKCPLMAEIDTLLAILLFRPIACIPTSFFEACSTSRQVIGNFYHSLEISTSLPTECSLNLDLHMWSPNIKSAIKGHFWCALFSADSDSIVKIFSCRCIVFLESWLKWASNTSPPI